MVNVNMSASPQSSSPYRTGGGVLPANAEECNESNAHNVGRHGH